jgi:hypothetical protein
MRKTILVLNCLLLAGACLAQQTTPARPAAATAPAATVARPAAPLVTTPPAPAPLPNALTDAQAAEMLDVTGASGLKAQVKQQMMSFFHTRVPYLPKDVSDDLEQTFDKTDLNAPIIAIYKAHITAADADAIIAFYKTPAGKSMMQALPAIMQQSQMAAMQLGQTTAREVMQKHRPEVDAAQKAYQQEHMPKPAPSLNTPPPATPAKPGTATVAPSTTKPASPTTPVSQPPQ